MNPSEEATHATSAQQINTSVQTLPVTITVTDGEWSSVDFEVSIEWERPKYLRVYVADSYLFFYLGDKPEFVEYFTISTVQDVFTFNFSDPLPNTVVTSINFARKNLITMRCDESTSKRTFTLASNVRYLRTNQIK